MNESTTSPTNLIVDWFGSTSRAMRVSLTLVLIVVILGLIQSSGLQTRHTMCELLGDCTLRDNEMQRIQVVLGQAGLDQYKVSDGLLLVPSSKRALYLNTLVESDSLPEHLRRPKQDNSNLNPFLSRTQQELIERGEKKRQIRELISRFPFVDEAWFEMDEAKSRSAFEPNRQTAVISIQPKNGRELTPAEVATVRQVIGGALAGIKSENIVVTDLSSGRAFQHGDSTNQDNIHQQVSYTNRFEDRKAFFTREVERALSTYPNLGLEVHYQSVAQQRESGNRFASMPRVVESQRRTNSMPMMSVGANGQASIEDMENSDADTPSRSDIEMAQNMRTTFVESVSVVVSVPQKAIEEKFGIKKPKALFGIPLETISAEQVDSSFEKIKSEMIEKIRPILPLASFENSKGYPISILLQRSEHKASHWAEVLKGQFDEHWPTLSVLLIGLVMLVMVTKSGAPKRNSLPKLATIAPEVAETEHTPEEIEKRAMAEEQLSRLIEQDPDTAAEVIKTWIRKAG